MLLNTKIFNATVETAKAKSANNPAMLRSILRAVHELNRSKYWAYDAQTNVLKLMSTTSKKLYVINNKRTCDAKSGLRWLSTWYPQLKSDIESLGFGSVQIGVGLPTEENYSKPDHFAWRANRLYL